MRIEHCRTLFSKCLLKARLLVSNRLYGNLGGNLASCAIIHLACSKLVFFTTVLEKENNKSKEQKL